MSIFKSGNPVLNDKIIQQNIIDGRSAVSMSVRGTLDKFFIMFLLVLGTAGFTWRAYAEGANVMPWMMGGIIGALVAAIVLSFKPIWAPVVAPIYALLEGLAIGGISAIYNFGFKDSSGNAGSGIVMQAVLLTFGVAIAMFLLYRFRIIKATEKFKMIIVTATLGIAVFYLLTLVLRLFGVEMPLIYSSGTWGIVLSLVIVAVAALNLILDFDRIETGVQVGLPRYMEWYCAFGLLVTLVWLYLEILRLLAKLNRR